MWVLSIDSELGEFAHEFLILDTAMLGIDEMSFFDARGILDDSTQFALIYRCLLIVHIRLHPLLAEFFV